MIVKSKLKVFLAVVFIVGVLTVFFLHSQGGTHTLVNAPMKDIEDAALKYTYARFQVLSEDVIIRLSRPVTKQELPLLGLPKIDFGGEDPPLALVVLMGNFDVRNLRRMNVNDAPWRVKFIAYVFDLKAGLPTLTSVSADGSRFRDLLNDPSLPMPMINDSQLEVDLQSPEPVSPATKLPYGSMAPPVPNPTGAPPPTER